MSGFPDTIAGLEHGISGYLDDTLFRLVQEQCGLRRNGFHAAAHGFSFEVTGAELRCLQQMEGGSALVGRHEPGSGQRYFHHRVLQFSY